MSWETGPRPSTGVWCKEAEWGSTRTSRVWRTDLEVPGPSTRILGGDDKGKADGATVKVVFMDFSGAKCRRRPD